MTARQLEVLQALAEGLTAQEIALRLVVEQDTVKNHLTNIYRRLEVGNAHGAVGLGYRMGLLTVPLEVDE